MTSSGPPPPDPRSQPGPPGQPGFAPPQQWVPQQSASQQSAPQQWAPPQWAPPQWAPTTAPPQGKPPVGSVRDDRRRKAWLVLAGVLALLMIYLCVITYWLTVHMVDRYQQAAPGETVTAGNTEYTLLALRRIPALPSGPGDTRDPVPGEAYVLATLRILTHEPENPNLSCQLSLLGPRERTWEYAFQSALDPQTAEADYCDGVRTDQPAQVTIGYSIPETDVDQVRGVVVPGSNGSIDRVLVPPT